MFLIKLTLILCCFTYQKAEEIQSNTQDDPKRRFYPFDLEDLQPAQWSEPIFNPFMPNYPILAEITPINQQSKQISDTFRGYISPTMISQVYYPYYSVMCEYPPKGKENNNKSDKDIDQLRQEYLQPMHEKMNDLASKLKNLKDLVVDQFSTQQETPTTPTPKKEDKPQIEEKPAEENSEHEEKSEEEEKPAEKPSIKLKPKLGVTKKPTPIKNDDTPNNKKKIKSPTISASKSNVNSQSGVFQCEGLTCPDETQSCKITEHATEPSYVDIVTTVFCLSSDNQVLLQKESTTPNPKKGSSLNNSRTISKNKPANMDFMNMDFVDMNMPNFNPGNINKNFENMENDFEKAMEQFNRNMNNTFRGQ